MIISKIKNRRNYVRKSATEVGKPVLHNPTFEKPCENLINKNLNEQNSCHVCNPYPQQKSIKQQNINCQSEKLLHKRVQKSSGQYQSTSRKSSIKTSRRNKQQKYVIFEERNKQKKSTHNYSTVKTFYGFI